MTVVTKNLGLVKAIHEGPNPPTNPALIWVNTNVVGVRQYLFDTELNLWRSIVDILSGGGGSGNVDYIRSEPVEKTVGGVKPGYVPDGTIQKFLDDVNYPFTDPTLAYSITNELVEKGVTVSSVSHTFNLVLNDALITLRKIERNSAIISSPVVNSGVFNETGLSLTFASNLALRTSVFTAIFSNALTITSNKVISFVAPSYYGVGPSNANQAYIKANCSKSLIGSKDLNATFSPIDSRYIYAYPASFGDLTSIKDQNGFEVKNSFNKTQTNFLLADGVTSELMNVYISNADTTQTNFRHVFQ